MAPESRRRRSSSGSGSTSRASSCSRSSPATGSRSTRRTTTTRSSRTRGSTAGTISSAARPSYAGMNDFALFDGKWFISFPPFPAILMLPLVWLVGQPRELPRRPVHRLARRHRPRGALPRAREAAAHRALGAHRGRERPPRAALRVRHRLLLHRGPGHRLVRGARRRRRARRALRPLRARRRSAPCSPGAMLGCMFLTRTTTLLVGGLLRPRGRARRLRRPERASRARYRRGPLVERAREVLARRSTAQRSCALVVALRVPGRSSRSPSRSWLNNARFHNPAPWAFGHEYLQVGWKTRIDRWGLFSFHFLPRNLAVMLGEPAVEARAERAEGPARALGMTFQRPALR